MSEYLRVKLKDVTSSIQTGPFGSQLHRSDYSNNGVPVVMPVNLINDSISEKGIARVSQEHVERLARHKASIGDIIYARRGDVGRCARVTQKEEGWLCGTGCLRVTPNEASINSDYLYYALSSDKIVRWVQNHAVGATMPNLNTGILESIPLTIPERKADQARIAGILSTYDKLIENNRKQIKLLEEAAQRLYKEWFIDLKFPGHETTPIDPTTNLPEGWVLDNMFSVAKYVRGASYSTENLVDEGEYLMVNLGNIQPFGGYRYSREKEYDGSVKDGSAVNAGCLVMGLTEQAEGLAGYAAVVPTLKKSAFASADLAIVQPFTVTPFYLYCCLRFGEVSRAISPLANGAKIKHLKPKSLMRISVTVPSWPLMKKFDLIISGLHQQMDVLQMQIEQAEEARDRLLPKLMSGEIEV